jgi:hypothetical protein
LKFGTVLVLIVAIDCSTLSSWVLEHIVDRPARGARLLLPGTIIGVLHGLDWQKLMILIESM